ncbi:MAG: class IV adenylate cyclase [bacterium]|nr:class IV adenylate cyclase [bacterium]
MTTKAAQDLEIEVKIKIDASPLEEFREKIIQIGSRLIARRSLEHNMVFDTPDSTLKKGKLLLRLRQKDNKNIVTFKRRPVLPGASDTYKIREEIEVEVSDFATMKKIFTGLGYGPVFIYEKYREIFQMGDVQLMVDETPIGNFLEIEGPEEAIDFAARRLGFGKNDYITANYRSLFKKAGGTGHMTFESPAAGD